MSEQAAEVVELTLGTDGAYSDLMDALAPGTEGEESDPPAQKAGGEAAPDGARDAANAHGADNAGADTDGKSSASAPPADRGGAAADTDSGGAADTASGEAAAGTGADAAGADGAGTDGGGATEPPTVAPPPDFGELSTAFEERTSQAYQQVALDEVRKEHAKYFEVLDVHPRALVGKQVPRMDGAEGMETLQDAADAREWQDAVKHQLASEVRERASKSMEENSSFMQIVHGSIDLFQNNADLIPGAKGFDKDLADRFASLATPYELRVEGKLQGYSIPVQPIIDQLRSQLVAEREAAASTSPPEGEAAADKPAKPAAPAAPAAPADPPQAGIQSKAGAGADPEDDYSVLFGTIGLPNLRI